ncbi:MAG: nitroreductase [Candidatus Omnitrophica bacterium CG22_combo_CG10-13_8_21_14_all_43_16]|nr:MAG: nitroreductase [Candidatus Omnitrophica bacterium CG22_combo_CG10-13_8_21_14_all_43_16]
MLMAETKLIQLPKPLNKGNISLEEVIFRRRSQRSFKQKDLSLQQISQLLWAGQGITAEKGLYSLRTAPSAGALYPIEIYLLAKNGLFRYLPDGHKLESLAEQDLRSALADSSSGQVAISQALSLGLGSVPIGAFNDEEVKKILSLPINHEPLYIIPVGY